MLSRTRHPRPRTLSNQSASEKDLPQSLRRRSVQSINSFSFRRLLGNEPLGHSFRPATSTEARNTIDGTRTKDRNDVHRSLPSRTFPIISQPWTKGRRSYQDQKDHQVQDPILLPAVDTYDCLPLAHAERESRSNAERPSSTLSPSPSATELLLRPLFSRKFHHLQNMGSKPSTLSRPIPSKETQSPKAQLEGNNTLIRPVSSPLPTPPENSSFKVVIPDRHSSITPRLNDSASTDRQTTKSYPSETSQPKSSNDTEKYSDQAPLLSHTSVPPTSSKIKPPTAADLPNTASPKLPSPRASTNTFRPLIPLLTLTISTPAPPLTPIHFACYQSHRHVHHSTNSHNPVPCMTCGNEGGRSRWKCQWCCLRICPACMEVLGKAAGRDLNVLVRKLEEEGRGFVGGRLEEWGEKVEREWKSGGGKGE